MFGLPANWILSIVIGGAIQTWILSKVMREFHACVIVYIEVYSECVTDIFDSVCSDRDVLQTRLTMPLVK